MIKLNNYKDLKCKYSDYIILQKAGFFYDVRDFGAIFFSQALGYKVFSDYSSKYKIGIPVNDIETALDFLIKSNYKYIITENYEIVEQYDEGISVPIIEASIEEENQQDEIIIITKKVLNSECSKILYKKLKQYCNNKADELNLPVYCICKNEYIEALVRELPRDIESLSKIQGFGNRRIEKYGEDLLSIIVDYLNTDVVYEEIEIIEKKEIKKLKKTKNNLLEEPSQVLTPACLSKIISILKEYRMKEAINIGLPPYCIFDNKSLEELTKYLPATHEELKCIYGFKEIKCEKYGDAILKIISDFLETEAEFASNNCLKVEEYSSNNKLKIFEKVQDAIDFINDVLNKTYKEKYPITDFTEELNVDDKTIILRCEGYTSNLKNIIRIFCQQNKSFDCDFINGQFNLIRKSEQQIQKELEIEEIQQQKNKIYAEKVSQIKEYILNQNKWVEITELEKLFGLKRRGKFIKDDNLSTVAHLINRFLKKEGFLTKRISSEFDYSIWVAGPDISLESLPAESESYTKNEEENNTVVFDDEQFTPFIDENEAIKIIEIATKDELDYDTKLSILQMEFGEIQDEHTNFESIGKFGSLNQYILEAYCVINNFTTRKWISANKINLDLLVIDAEPVEFQILRENGKPSQYCLYNLCQTAEYKESRQTKISTKEGDIIVTKKDITDAILGLISKYDGIFGRVATIKILTGNFDEDEHNIKQNEYYNKFPDRYANVITTIINKLVKNNRLSLNEKYRLCFVCPKEEIDNKEDERDFLKIVQLIKQEKNVFVTGNAGTGKSYLLNKLKSKYKKRLELTSTTGLAAVNIKGVTIHSWAGVGICKKDIFKCVQDILGKKQLSKKIRNCDLLAIDEISMLKGHTFSYIDQVLRMVRECDKPFGGIQLLLFGDFFQLPPVEETGNEKDFCFETQTWKELDLEVVKLETIYRQTELPFIKALNNIRINNPDEEDIKLLKSREIDYDTTDTTMLHIFSRNEEADSYNLKKFNALTNPLYQFNATSGVYRGDKYIQTDLNDREKLTLEIFKKNCRASEYLCLKKGSRVMLLINLDFDKGLINGACGEITALSQNSVTVLFDNGVETTIEQNKFEYYYNDAVVATMIQYPLKLAYAITIHKSQGMTLENVVVDCNRIFEEGQTYVALSRVKKLNGLYLKGFSADKIKVNQKVVDYYQTI